MIVLPAKDASCFHVHEQMQQSVTETTVYVHRNRCPIGGRAFARTVF